MTIKSRLDREHLPTPNESAIAVPDISFLPRLQAKRLGAESVAQLFAKLAQLPLDTAADLILCGYLIGPPTPEVAIQRMPSAFTEAISSASYDSLARAAQLLDDHTRTTPIVSASRGVLDTMVLLVQLRAMAAWSRSAGTDLFALTATYGERGSATSPILASLGAVPRAT